MLDSKKQEVQGAIVQKKPVVVSGIQPSGQLHLGNYIGALSVWVANQTEYKNFLFVADLHAATTLEELTNSNIAKASREAAALYIAAGIDPSQSVIFLQSDVQQHAYLGWLMICSSPMGWLDRMTQFKSKSSRREVIGAGLYTYPALQAADILLYDADYVPVGDDQRQHVEFTRDIAQRFNSLFGADCLKVPQPLMRKSGARIMGLDDPEEKMSKSLVKERPTHAVQMLDSNDTIRKKFRVAKTDSGGPISFEASSPGVVNLLTIYEALTGEVRASIEASFSGKGYKILKDRVADVVIEKLEPIRSEFEQLTKDPGYLDSILDEGAQKAIAVSSKTVARVRTALRI